MKSFVKYMATLVAVGLGVLLAPSCEIVDTIGRAFGRTDSLVTVVCLPDKVNFSPADIFIYSDGELKRLEGHVRVKQSGDTAYFRLPEGDKMVVGLAGCSHEFSDEALDAYDSMELLRFYYEDESPGVPMMSATASCRAGDTITLGFSSAMCCIELDGIEHSFTDYKRLEDPVMYLEDVNPYVEALRRDTFMPEETVSDTSGLRGLMWERLPYDIGMYPQQPGTKLYCYPNESSLRPTVLVVEGTPSGGRKCRFRTELPRMTYGSRLSVSLVISEEPGTYEFDIDRI